VAWVIWENNSESKEKKRQRIYLVEGGSTADVTRGNRGTRAKAVGGNLGKEKAAVVDLIEQF